MQYMAPGHSACEAYGADIETVLRTVADRYVGANPRVPFVFRLSSRQGFLRNERFGYVFDCGARFPDARREQSVYAWGGLWSEGESEFRTEVRPYGPTEIFVNGESVYRTDCYEEKVKEAQPIHARLQKGWNSFVLRFIKTPFGFGGEIGRNKYAPLVFFSPLPSCEGMEGFVYTRPMDGTLDPLPTWEHPGLPDDADWLPVCEWDEAQRAQKPMRRIFGLQPGRFAYGWARLEPAAAGRCHVAGTAGGPLTLYVQGRPVLHTEGGAFAGDFDTGAAVCNLVAECCCGQEDWGFTLAVSRAAAPVHLSNPCRPRGMDDPWLYAGPFAEKQDVGTLAALPRTFVTDEGEDYWRVDRPAMYVRPFVETPQYGQWNYPVGVTLFGLARAGEWLRRPDLNDYVTAHLRLCAAYYGYSLWDRRKFGAPGVNAQAATIESLDDCGSFAFTLLDGARRAEMPDIRRIADAVYDHMAHRQSRLPDGAFWRVHSCMPDMVNTMWLDDLYMSVPFLCRYYELTGNTDSLDDAARQFLLFRDRMRIADNGLLSHVYYPVEKLATGVPWGRGNGWVMLSLTELLALLPAAHPLRPQLLDFFETMCGVYAGVQDKEGLWHQVLNDPDSYAEASCTAMFVCAFARGVRHGWLADRRRFTDAAVRGWEGLTRTCIDREGNLYGICRGSGHSFTPRYYKYDLGWILNDPHGTGVVLTAGCEVAQMLRELSVGTSVAQAEA